MHVGLASGSPGIRAIESVKISCRHHTLLHDGQLAVHGAAPDLLLFEFRRAGDDEPHLVLTSAPVLLDDENSVPRGTEPERET